MQLVITAAVLGLAVFGQGCSFVCQLKNVQIPVESCGTNKFVHSTICEGRCYLEDPNYESKEEPPKQRICNGDWSYEVEYFEGCPEGVTYPVARSCECTSCNPNNTDCGRVYADC